MADLSKLSEADLVAISEGRMQDVSEEALMEIAGETPKEPSLPAKALDYGLRGLDYAGGLVRGGVAGAAELATGKELVDASDVIRGKAPSTSDVLEKLGVPEGMKLSDVLPESMYSDTGAGLLKFKKGGMLDPSVRGVAGFLGDVALDPLTYLSGGVSAAAKAGKAGKTSRVVLTPVQEALKATGKMAYRKGLKNIDARIVERGGDAVSPYLMERGVWGGLGSIQKGIEKGKQLLAPKRESIYAQIERAGNKVYPAEASERALRTLAETAKNPYLKKQVDEGLDFISLAKDPMDVSLASDVKTALYDALPASSFTPDGKLTTSGQKLMRDLSRGYKEAIESAGERTAPGLGSKIAELNKEWGSYLSADKPTRQELSKATKKNIVTEVKAGVGAVSPEAAAAMYAGKAFNTTPVMTGLGLGLKKIGEKVPESVWRRLLINQGQDR